MMIMMGGVRGQSGVSQGAAVRRLIKYTEKQI